MGAFVMKTKRHGERSRTMSQASLEQSSTSLRLTGFCKVGCRRSNLPLFPSLNFLTFRNVRFTFNEGAWLEVNRTFVTLSL